MTGTLSPTAEGVLSYIHDVAASLRRKQAALIAVTGIDASGKGYLACRLGQSLRQEGLRTAIINVDSWLNLPYIRFGKSDPAANFYENAIRFEEMFEQLVLPLTERRAVSVEANFASETATAYTKHHYHFTDVDVILLEGIYLLKRRFQTLYGLAVWVDCTFETALERAIARNQEGLSPEDTIHAYEAIYFPAQKFHFERDSPREAASMIVVNDPRIDLRRVRS